MKWKVLTALDIAFSSLAIISALVFGNGLVAEHVPRLHENATWLSKLILTGFTSPNALADWALGSLPALVVLLALAVFFLAEMLLVTLSPLLVGVVAFAATKKYAIDFQVAYKEVRTNRTMVSYLRRQTLRRVMANLSTRSLIAFGAGLVMGGMAWAIALLINTNSGGVVQTLVAVVAIGVLLFAKVIVDAILEEVTAEADGLDTFRDTFIQGAK